MSMSRFAILLDGAFVIKRLETHLRRFPTAPQIQQLCDTITQFDEFQKTHCDVMLPNSLLKFPRGQSLPDTVLA